MPEIDKTIMTELKAAAADLKAWYAARDEQYTKYDEMYFMTWSKKMAQQPGMADKRLVQSPDGRDAVMGAVRLMIATDPIFNVTEESDTQQREKIEKWAKQLWDASGRIYGEPVHYGSIMTGMLYDEMHTAINPTQELVTYAKNKHDQARKDGKDVLAKYLAANIAQAEDVADRTPFLLEAWSPRYAYTEFGRFGNVVKYYKEESIPVGELRARYGWVNPDDIGTGNVVLSIFYDEVYYAAWTDKIDLDLNEHGLGSVPVRVQILNGSRVFANPEESRQPLLYGLMKSGLLDTQNLALTVMATGALDIGAGASDVYIPGEEGSEPVVDEVNRIIKLHKGDQWQARDLRNLIPEAIANIYQLAEGKSQETTIYKQALGGMAERSTTYSEAALFAQAGRLPLTGPQRRGGWGIGDVIETCIRMGKANPEYLKGSGIKASDLAGRIQIEAKLEVKLPQEKLAQANIGAILLQNGFSFDFVAQNIIGINRPEEETRRKWTEQAQQLLYQEQMKKIVAMVQQAMTQGVPGMGGKPGAGANGAPPQDLQAGAQMAQGQAERVQGGLPPQQAGMIPGEGMAQVPEGMNDAPNNQ